FDLGNVILIFQEYPQGIVNGSWVQGDLVELDQCLRPVDGFGYAGQLEKVAFAQVLNESHHLSGELVRYAWRTHPQNHSFSYRVLATPPMLESAPFKCIMSLAGAL